MQRASSTRGRPERALVVGLLAVIAADCAGGPPAGLVLSDPAPIRSLASTPGPWRTLRVRVPPIADDKTRVLGTTDVRVAVGDDDTARVDVFLYSPNMGWATRVFESTGMRVERDGELLLVEAGRADTNVGTGLSVGLQPMGGRPPSRDSAVRRLSILVEATVPPEVDVDIEIGAGAVQIEQISGEALIEVLEGDVHIDSIIGNLQVRTGSGDLTIRDAALALGRLTTGEGDIDIVLRRADSMLFVAAHGNIEIRLPAALGTHLDLRAREVHVDPGLDVLGSRTSQSVRGTLNGGGGVLEASSPEGRIRIQPNR